MENESPWCENGKGIELDDKNEKIIKLIEKYSFIINKFRQKSDNFENFDFKLKELSKWKVFLHMDEKDNIGDILLKANEEKDLVLTPKELVFYKQKYTYWGTFCRVLDHFFGPFFNGVMMLNPNKYCLP